MNQLNRKMAFYEIHKGRLAVDMQKRFEEIQKIAHNTGQKTSVTLKIMIDPPEDAQDKFGKVSYDISTKIPAKKSIKLTTEKIPAKKSIKLTTELRDGFIVADGETPVDVLQTELEFPPKLEMKASNGKE